MNMPNPKKQSQEIPESKLPSLPNLVPEFPHTKKIIVKPTDPDPDLSIEWEEAFKKAEAEVDRELAQKELR